MDMTTLAAAAESAKAALGMARAAAAAAVDHQLKAKLIEVQQGILDVQMQLGDATAERLTLLQNVADLTRTVADLKAAKAALDGYALCEVEQGKYLYKARPEAGHAVAHYACPSCFDAGRISVLQSPKTGSQQVIFKCTANGCSFAMYVGPSDPPKRRQLVAKAPGINSW